MAFCINCGKELPDEARFCPECGKSTLTNQTGYASVNHTSYRSALSGEITDSPQIVLNLQHNGEAHDHKRSVLLNPIVGVTITIAVLMIIFGITMISHNSSVPESNETKTSLTVSPIPAKAALTTAPPEMRDISIEKMAQTFSSYLSELGQFSEAWSAFFADKEYTQESADSSVERFSKTVKRLQEMHKDVEAMTPDPLCSEWKQTMLEILSDMEAALNIIVDMDADGDGYYSLIEVTDAKTHSSEYIPIIRKNIDLITKQALEISKTINQIGSTSQQEPTAEKSDTDDSTAVTPEPTIKPTARPTVKPTSKPSIPSNTGKHTNADAFSIAEYVVKEFLKAPSTAKFCKVNEATITYLGNDKYEVKGWVDSQNSYGAMIRQRFTVTYTAVKKGSDIGCTGAKCTFSDW